MASFCIFRAPAGRPRAVAFVRDGFSLPAALLGPFWFAWHRAWISAALWLAVVCALLLAKVTLGLPASALAGALVALGLITGLEGAAARGRELARKGYRLVSVIESGNRADAETIHFAREFASPAPHSAAEPARVSSKAGHVGVFIEGSR